MMSSAAREINAIAAVAARDISKGLKSPGLIIATLIFPIIFMGIMGGNLSQNLAGNIGFNYLQFVMIGMIVSTMFTGTISGMSALIEERNQNLTQELFVSPISRYAIIIGKMIGSGFSSMFGLVGVLLVAVIMQIPLGGMNIVWLFAITPVFGLVGASLGIFFIGFVQDSKVADMGSLLLIMPQMFLAGVIIPVAHSTGVLGLLAKLMPMTYSVDLARTVFYWGQPEYELIVLHHPLLNIVVMTGFFLLFSIVGTIMFTRSERNR